MVMPSSLLLMSGTLPTEVFKMLPVVHSRTCNWGVGGGCLYAEMRDKRLLKKILK